MPFYDYQDAAGHQFTKFLTLAHFQDTVPCDCGLMASIRITAPLLVKVAADMCYDSPIDGAPITTRHAREEDLKRHNCHPYDPDVKTDYDNRVKQEDAELDRSIDASVEEAIEHMPTATRGKLASELTEQGFGVEYGRTTPHA